MNINLEDLQNSVYKSCDFKITALRIETESTEYDACQFTLNRKQIISRSSKITPKKVGQFVTFWKRANATSPIAPFDTDDNFDFFVVNIRTNHHFGQFVFPKALLIKKGIISTATKEGKRAFRVYPSWDIPTSKQAEKTQKWQLDYFYDAKTVDLEKMKSLYL